MRRWIAETLIGGWVLASWMGLGAYPLSRAAFGAKPEAAWTMVCIVWGATLLMVPLSILIAFVRLKRRDAVGDIGRRPASPAVVVVLWLISIALMIAGIFVIGMLRPLGGIAAVAFGAMGVAFFAYRYRDVVARSAR